MRVVSTVFNGWITENETQSDEEKDLTENAQVIGHSSRSSRSSVAENVDGLSSEEMQMQSTFAFNFSLLSGNETN